MLPTSNASKHLKDAPTVEVYGCIPFSASNANCEPRIMQRALHNSVKDQTSATSLSARNRSKSSSNSDNHTVRLIDFEDSSINCTDTANSSLAVSKSNNESNADGRTRRRSLSSHYDGDHIFAKNSLVITNSNLTPETNPNKSLSSINFNDEIRFALPAKLSPRELRECPPHHVAYLLRITREKNIQLKKKRKRVRKPKEDLIPVQRQTKPIVNSIEYQLPNKLDKDKITISNNSRSISSQHIDPIVDLQPLMNLSISSSPSCSYLLNGKKPSKQFSRSDLLKVRDQGVPVKPEIIDVLKSLNVHVEQASSIKRPPHQVIPLRRTCIAPDLKIKEYLSSSWHDLDDETEERASREIYENLKQIAQHFDDEGLDIKTKDNAPESKSKKKKNKKKTSENGESKTKAQNDTENELFEEYYSEELVEKGLQDGSLVKDIIRINQKNYKEAYIFSPDDKRDIFIDGVHDRNRAFDGDEVVIALHSEDKWKVHSDESVQKCGKVVFVSKANHPRSAVGYLKVIFKRNKMDKIILSPRDSRIPRIKIPANFCPPNLKNDFKRYENYLYEGKIIKWDTVNFAEGILLQELGEHNDIEIETKCILLENHLNVDPMENFEQYLSTTEETIPDYEIANRLDLRAQCIFTIDPAGAKDLDDALSCVKLPDGTFEVGIHIADVSHYLTPDTPLDENAREKATSVYLVRKVFHMLPNKLCELCSLTPGADKLAFSLIVQFDEDAKIIGHRFSKTVIRSCTQFCYHHAQEIMDKDANELDAAGFPSIENNFALADCIETVTNLQFLARKIRKRRFDEGALKIDQPKIVFDFDDDACPKSYSLFVAKESNWLIEEFMLIANILTANHLREKFPDLALLRNHSPPNEKNLSAVVETLEKIGIYIDISSAGSIYHSMLRYEGFDEIGTARMAVIVNLLVKPMLKARYLCSISDTDNDAIFWHYALNVPFYTHFTSPIRRYADITVHRLLASSLGYCELPKWTSDDIESIAENCNKKKNSAKKASECSSELFLKLYMERHGPVKVRAVVIEVKERYFDAIDLSTRTNNRVYADKIKPAQVKFENNEGMASLLITWKEDGSDFVEQVIQMFTIIDLQLVYNKIVNKVTATLLKPSS